MRSAPRSAPLFCLLAMGSMGGVAVASIGCVEAGTGARATPSAKVIVPSEVRLPDKEFFPGCVAGSELRGYPILPGADAAFCATIVEPSQREGAFRAYYPSGQLLAKGAYQKGDPWGVWTTYHENGQTLSEGAFYDSVRMGLWRFFRADGKPVLEESYSEGKRAGYTEYEYRKGTLFAFETFEVRAGGDVSHGPAGRALPNGDLLTGVYKEGLAEGLWEEKTPKGDVALRLTMSGGFAEGPAKALWPATGKPGIEGDFVKTLPQGTVRLTYPNGEKRAELTYEKGLLRALAAHHPGGVTSLEGAAVDGIPDGVWTAYHPDGSPRIKGAFRRGLRQGMWRAVDPSGKPSAEGLYEAGLLVEGQRVDPAPWTSIGAGEPLEGLFTALGFITAGRGEVAVEQRAKGQCMLLGDPVSTCLSLDWESTPSPHAGDGPSEVIRREKQQEIACAMDNPADCARVGKRLYAAAEKAPSDRARLVKEAAGYEQKACDLSPGETAWKARDATGRALYKGFHSASACVWLGRLLAKGEVKSKSETPQDLYKIACDQGLEEGCSALAESPAKPSAAPPKTPVTSPRPKKNPFSTKK